MISLKNMYSNNPFSANPFSADFTLVRFVKESKIIHLVRFLFYKFHFSAVSFWDFILSLLLIHLVRIHLVRQIFGTKIRTKGVLTVVCNAKQN